MDTITIICGSVAMCVRKMAGVCQPCVKECASCNDLTIVGIICATILLLAIIAVLSYFKVKADERKAQDALQGKPGGESGTNNNVKAEYISKLLKHLESLAIQENVAKYDKNGSDRYIKELKNLINKGTVTDEEQKP